MPNPLFQVQTIYIDKTSNERLIGTDGSDNKQTVATINSKSLTFGNIAPGETSETQIVYLKIPNSISVKNIKLSLIDTGGITFSNDIFGIEIYEHVDTNIVPNEYFTGVNIDEISTSPYNISIPNASINSSIYVYLNIRLPLDQQLQTGTIRYKWFFDYADEEIAPKKTFETALTPTWGSEIESFYISDNGNQEEESDENQFYDIFVMSIDQYNSYWRGNLTEENYGTVWRLELNESDISSFQQDIQAGQNYEFWKDRSIYRPINSVRENINDLTQTNRKPAFNAIKGSGFPLNVLNSNMYLRRGTKKWGITISTHAGYLSGIYFSDNMSIDSELEYKFNSTGYLTYLYLFTGTDIEGVYGTNRISNVGNVQPYSIFSEEQNNLVKINSNTADTNLIKLALNKLESYYTLGNRWAFLQTSFFPSSLVVKILKEGYFYPSWYDQKYATTATKRYLLK